MLIFEMDTFLPWNHYLNLSFLFIILLNGKIISLHYNTVGQNVVYKKNLPLDIKRELLAVRQLVHRNTEGEEIFSCILSIVNKRVVPIIPLTTFKLLLFFQFLQDIFNDFQTWAVSIDMQLDLLFYPDIRIKSVALNSNYDICCCAWRNLLFLPLSPDDSVLKQAELRTSSSFHLNIIFIFWYR